MMKKTTKRLTCLFVTLVLFISAAPLSTLAASNCTNDNNHIVEQGNVPGWFSTITEAENAAKEYVKQKNKELKQQLQEANEYENCKYSYYSYDGYEAWGCYCGKWTANAYRSYVDKGYDDGCKPYCQWDEGTVITAATCTKKGTKEVTCTYCNAPKTIETAALGHKWNSGSVTTQPTCTAKGVKTFTCTRSGCSATKTSDVAALGHNLTEQTVQPSCTTAGYTMHVCTRSGCNYSQKCTGTDVAALGHQYTSQTIAPTCTTQGYTLQRCQRCNAEHKINYANATGHSYVYVPINNRTHKKNCANCSYSVTENCNVVNNKCTLCNADYTPANPDPTEPDDPTPDPTCSHTWNAGVITTQPTCTATGVKTFTCTKCNSKKTAQVAVLGHDYTRTVIPSTCAVQGYTEHKCTRCGNTLQSARTPLLAHEYKATVVPASHDKAGSRTYTCTGCGDTYSETIAPTGHKSVDKRTVTQATMTADGVITAATHCNICNLKLSEKTTVIPSVASVTLSASVYVYNGKVKTPGVTVKDRTGKVLTKNTDYTVIMSQGRQKVGSYNVKVIFKGNYSGSKEMTFKIVAKPKATALKSVKAKKKSFVAKWKKVSGVKGYQIQYATNKKFTKGKKTKTVKGAKKTSVTIKKLKKKTYYVRIRTYKVVNGKKVYSKWSKAKPVTIKK